MSNESMRAKIQNRQVKIEMNQSNVFQQNSREFGMPFFVKGTDLRYISCNEAFLKLLQITEEAVVGVSQLDIDTKAVIEMDQRLIEQGGIIEVEFVVTKASGEQRHCIMTKSLLKGLDDEVLGVAGIICDVTQEREQNIRSQKLMILKDAMVEITYAIMDNWSEKVLFDLILEMGVEVIENSDHGSVLMIDDDDMLTPVAWFGYTDEAMKNFKVRLKDTFNWLATDGHAEQSVMINDITPYLANWDLPDIAETKDEAIIWATLCSPIMVNGEVVGVMNMDSSMKDAFTEIDMDLVDYMSQQIQVALEKRQRYDQVVYFSKHDEMTGLLNRRAFEDLAKTTLAQAEKLKEGFCLVVFDINDLKQINDNYGHQMGDVFIQQFSKCLKGIFRETDILGRYGGDEFVGVFRSMDIDMIKQRIDEALVSLKRNPVDLGDTKTPISFSYGIACYPDDGKSYEALVSVADRLMYACKSEWKL